MDPPDSETRRLRFSHSIEGLGSCTTGIAREFVQRFMRDVMV